MSLPFLGKKPISLPPIVSVELIQITDKTNIPFAPKAKKIINRCRTEEITILLFTKNYLSLYGSEIKATFVNPEPERSPIISRTLP